MNVTAIHSYFAYEAKRPFRLGKSDCATFVIRVLKIGFDKDYSEAVEYFDRVTAVRQCRAMGGLRAAADETFGEKLEASELRCGDVAYFEIPRPTLGIVLNDYVAVRGHRRVHRVAVDSALGGWRVP